MTTRQRADRLLVARGLFESRARAQAAIAAGHVTADGVTVRKASDAISSAAFIEAQPEHPYVSRGGVKLAAALDHFRIDVAGRICLDVGASTGGFTDVLLSRGAAKVYAVDVGFGQLAWKLRQDSRVVVLERTNARHLTAREIPEPVDLVTCDASFIGLETVLPAGLALAKPRARLVALIKPQFEVGPDRVGKGGVVRDSDLHREVCERISAWIAAQGWEVAGVVESPLKGPEGNTEFLIAASRG
jgi:23S rRNA (cytidine1920-2'-O)/16S rRNA (cytidine1409-2'-O)-methyltransferase